MGTQYITRAEFYELATEASALNSVSTDVVDKAIASACAMADTELRARFHLPLKTWEQDLKQLVADMAVYLAFKRRGWNTAASEYDQLKEGYDDALATLRRVGANKSHLAGIEETTDDPGHQTRWYALDGPPQS